MAKYKITTHYTTHFDCIVEADSVEEAKEKSNKVFWDTSDKVLHKTFFRNRQFVEEDVELV